MRKSPDSLSGINTLSFWELWVWGITCIHEYLKRVWAQDNMVVLRLMRCCVSRQDPSLHRQLAEHFGRSGPAAVPAAVAHHHPSTGATHNVREGHCPFSWCASSCTLFTGTTAFINQFSQKKIYLALCSCTSSYGQLLYPFGYPSDLIFFPFSEMGHRRRRSIERMSAVGSGKRRKQSS